MIRLEVANRFFFSFFFYCSSFVVLLVFSIPTPKWLFMMEYKRALAHRCRGGEGSGGTGAVTISNIVKTYGLISFAWAFTSFIRRH